MKKFLPIKAHVDDCPITGWQHKRPQNVLKGKNVGENQVFRGTNNERLMSGQVAFSFKMHL